MFTTTLLANEVAHTLRPDERSMRALGRPIRILSVSPARTDHLALRQILRDPSWQISAAEGCVEAMARLTWDRINIVVCESKLPDGSWRDLLRSLDENAEPLILIVTSALADDHLWAEVLNLGGFDVLSKPFQAEEVRRVLANARARFARPLFARASGG
jgi:DNA-binding NtrC family response regulator